MRTSVAVGVGVVLVAILACLWAALHREPREQATERPAAEAGARANPIPSAVPVRAAEVEGGGGDARAFDNRFRGLEERVRVLGKTRDSLREINADLKNQLAAAEIRRASSAVLEERQREQFAAMEDAAVKHVAASLGLNDTQREAYRALWLGWKSEDKDRAASREVWRAREASFGSLLNPEQAAKQHQQSATQVPANWGFMPLLIGQMAGVTDQALHERLKSSLGAAPPIPNEMLLPGAHGLDLPGLCAVAAERLRPLLTPEQVATLDRKLKK